MRTLNRTLAEEMLTSFNIDKKVLDRYDEPHRFYHNWSHIDDLLQMWREGDFKVTKESYILFLSIIFHDIVYSPMSHTNEEDSIDFFREVSAFVEYEVREEVIQIIQDTKHHQPSSPLSRIFCDMDMSILRQPLTKLIEYEEKIFKEFQFIDWETYKIERVKFLEGVIKDGDIENVDLQNLIVYIETRKPKIGIYPGSFNPFHKGHLNILEKAEQIFDKVIIAQGTNPLKDRKQIDIHTVKTLQFRQIKVYEGLLTSFIDSLGYDVTLVRGLRDSTDLHYEITQHRYFQDLKPDIKSISIVCDQEYSYYSSTGIRTLEQFDKADKYKVI